MLMDFIRTSAQLQKKAWGYSPDELIGKKHFYDLHPEENREGFKNAALKVFATKQSFSELENPILTSNKKITWVFNQWHTYSRRTK